MSQHTPESPARRRALLVGGAGLGSLALAACTPRTSTAADGQNAASSSGNLLELTPQTTEGPYYFDPGLVRQDITEGMPGIPIEVVFTVRDQSGKTLPDLRVDIWHCNAAGVYSGYAGQGDDRRTSTTGETFLRGSQPTDAQGRARFSSIYPGWYRGRTTHIHFKVIRGDVHILTCQFFLPDALSEYLYTHVGDYARKELRDMLNSQDGIALAAGPLTHGNVKQNADRYVIALDVVVDPAATPSIDRPGNGGPPGGGAGGPPPGPPPGEGDGGARRPPPGMQAALTGEARIDAIVPKPQGDSYKK